MFTYDVYSIIVNERGSVPIGNRLGRFTLRLYHAWPATTETADCNSAGRTAVAVSC